MPDLAQFSITSSINTTVYQDIYPSADLFYGSFAAAGLFVGSRVVEAACKTIVCSRLKRAGAHWSKKIAANIIAIRYAIMSKEFNKHLPKGSVYAA